MDEKQQIEKLEKFKALCQQALDNYPCPPLARNYKQGLTDLIGMADMYLDELKEQE